jgi:hypothetical protein
LDVLGRLSGHKLPEEIVNYTGTHRPERPRCSSTFPRRAVPCGTLLGSAFRRDAV